MSDKFKNAMGHFLLKALFYEETLADKSSVLYTLKDQDHEGFPSLYRLYMEMDDPTEYLFATSFLDGWAHWERLCESTWFKPFVARWRRELDLRSKALALIKLKELAKEGKDTFAANKFLVTGGWKEPGAKRRAGQPSKEEIRQAAQQIASEKDILDEDFSRITGVQ